MRLNVIYGVANGPSPHVPLAAVLRARESRPRGRAHPRGHPHRTMRSRIDIIDVAARAGVSGSGGHAGGTWSHPRFVELTGIEPAAARVRFGEVLNEVEQLDRTPFPGAARCLLYRAVTRGTIGSGQA